MDIRYACPGEALVDRLKKLEYIDDSFPLDLLEHVQDLVAQMAAQFGDRVFADLPKLLKSGRTCSPSRPRRRSTCGCRGSTMCTSRPSRGAS